MLPQTLYAQAESLRKEKKYHEALARYRQAVALEPAYRMAWYGMSAAFLGLGDGAAAEDCMDRASKIDISQNRFPQAELPKLRGLIGLRLLQVLAEDAIISYGDHLDIQVEGKILLFFQGEGPGRPEKKMTINFYQDFGGELDLAVSDSPEEERYGTGIRYTGADGREQVFSHPFQLTAKDGEDHPQWDRLSSIRIYRYSHPSQPGKSHFISGYDYISFIDLETFAGRRVVIHNDRRDKRCRVQLSLDSPGDLGWILENLQAAPEKAFENYQLVQEVKG